MEKTKTIILKGNKRIRFKNINSEVWEHPADRLALKTLRKVKGMDELIKFFMGSTTERSLNLIHLASSVRVSERQFSKIYQLHLEACGILDMEKIPELYVSQNPLFNAGAIGVNKPFIVLNSSLLDAFNKEEILTVIGHELAHIKSGHVLYKTLLSILLNLSTLFITIPLSGLILSGIIAALKEWNRKSELSCDRAGLLTVQDPEIPVQLLMKMAGGGQIKQMDLSAFIEQAEEYNQSDSFSDNIHKILNALGHDHPFHVLRVLELISWVRSGEYDNILRGFYKAKEEKQNIKDDFEQVKTKYKTDFEDTIKPIKDMVKKFMTKKEEK